MRDCEAAVDESLYNIIHNYIVIYYAECEHKVKLLYSQLSLVTHGNNNHQSLLWHGY